MKYIEPREYPPLPMWHYRGFTGIPAWFSEMHKDVIKERVDRVMRANNVKGRTMRFCCRCEGPIGIMAQALYEFLYVDASKRCCMCGNKAYNVEGLSDDD